MTIDVGIIDYGLGNLTSVTGAVAKLGHTSIVSSNVEELALTEKLILPGVGAFRDGMQKLGERKLIEPLGEIVLQDKKPILGICLGSQLLTRQSDEFGDHPGLGWIDAEVKRFSFDDNSLRVPHVGWNDLNRATASILLDGLPETPMVYYVHSHYITDADRQIIIGECEYGLNFVAAMAADNIYATQFHPEKSQMDGLALLKNYLEKC
jgi:imidazole glycerol-phosphate synthase subunit HisH